MEVSGLGVLTQAKLEVSDPGGHAVLFKGVTDKVASMNNGLIPAKFCN